MTSNASQKALVFCLRQNMNEGTQILNWFTMLIIYVPFATPQTFSRIVVFPAFALPITRMRKCGHLYRSLSTFIFSSLISDRHQSIFTDTHFDLLIETGFRDISEAESAIAIFVLAQKR